MQEVDLQLGGPVAESCTYLHLRAIALKDNFTVLLIADQTERYRVEAMRRAFITDASHELRVTGQKVCLKTGLLTGIPENRVV